MKQIKQFTIPLILYFLIICGVYFVILFLNEHREYSSFTLQEFRGKIVAYEEDDNGPIVIVSDIESERLMKFQFIGGVSEEVYGKGLKYLIENEQCGTILEIYYIEEVSEPAYIVDMAYIDN